MHLLLNSDNKLHFKHHLFLSLPISLKIRREYSFSTKISFPTASTVWLLRETSTVLYGDFSCFYAAKCLHILVPKFEALYHKKSNNQQRFDRRISINFICLRSWKNHNVLIGGLMFCTNHQMGLMLLLSESLSNYLYNLCKRFDIWPMPLFLAPQILWLSSFLRPFWQAKTELDYVI